MRLHQNAAIRILRNEIERVREARAEAADALTDPRLPIGVAQAQVRELDLDLADLEDGLMVLEAVGEMDLPTMQRLAV